jgi:hypothetical protein
MKNNEVILHGECMVFLSELPSNLKKMEKKPFVIVAPSETTGNHHVVDVIDGVDFYEDESGKLFMKSSVSTVIRCVHTDRHDAITIPAGTYEFGSQQEYDPFTARLQAVRD